MKPADLFVNLLGAGLLALLAACSSAPDRSGSQELPTVSDLSEEQRRAQIRLQLAVGYYQQGQFSTALDELKQALQIDPNFADAHNVRGLTYMEMGEMNLAEDSFLRALRLAPNNPELLNNYGWFLCQTSRPGLAIAQFDAAVRVRSYQTPERALNNAGVCSLRLKDQAAAERYLNQAFEIDPGNMNTNVNLAKLHYARADYQRARFYINRVLKGRSKATADELWTAIRVERKLGDRMTENSLVTQLRRNYPQSRELASYMRGNFDE